MLAWSGRVGLDHSLNGSSRNMIDLAFRCWASELSVMMERSGMAMMEVGLY